MRQNFLNISLLILTLSFLVACSKNDNNQPGPTHMRWISVNPKINFDVYSNQEKIASNLTFDTLTNYASGLPSFYSLQIAKAGTSDTLINGRQQLTSGNYYSMFLLPDTTGGVINTEKATVSIVTENTSVPAIDTIKLRFFNFAPFSPSVNVVMTIDGRVGTNDTLRPFVRRIYNDQSYTSGYSTYVPMYAINWKIHFYNAADSMLLDSFHYQFRSQGIYTLYLKNNPNISNPNSFKYNIIQRGY